MMDAGSLRWQLAAIIARTESARSLPPSFIIWLPKMTLRMRESRQVVDDLQSRRISWRGARISAETGLAALERDDLATAEIYLTNAIWLYIDALEKHIRPSI